MQQLSLFEEPSPKIPSLDEIVYWKLFVDGAARNNPGPAGAGIYITKNDVPVMREGYYLGSKTNNQAEYLALVLGLLLLKPLMNPYDILLIISDSQLLIRQFQGHYKVKHPELKTLHDAARSLLRGINVDFMHVLREDNTIADAMANKGINEKRSVPPEFLAMLQSYGISL